MRFRFQYSTRTLQEVTFVLCACLAWLKLRYDWSYGTTISYTGTEMIYGVWTLVSKTKIIYRYSAPIIEHREALNGLALVIAASLGVWRYSVWKNLPSVRRLAIVPLVAALLIVYGELMVLVLRAFFSGGLFSCFLAMFSALLCGVCFRQFREWENLPPDRRLSFMAVGTVLGTGLLILFLIRAPSVVNLIYKDWSFLFFLTIIAALAYGVWCAGMSRKYPAVRLLALLVMATTSIVASLRVALYFE